MDSNYEVIAVVGPTAVGKSAVADELAYRLGSEVLSADAMQIYTGMDIGTAKMKPGECKAPLRLVDLVDPGFAYSAALYQKDARAHIDYLLKLGKTPVVCGGTGLYVRAALDEMDFPTGKVEDRRRASLNRLAEELGPEALHAVLAEKDPESAAVIHPHNVRRVVRALEMHEDGESYAKQKDAFSSIEAKYPSLYIGLDMDRARLYGRIDARVDLMFNEGLVEEVEGLVAQGYASALTSMQAIGYKEVIAALQGACSMDESKELVKQRSRRYAKRQLSWFRRDERMHWLNMDELSLAEAVETVLQLFEAH